MSKRRTPPTPAVTPAVGQIWRNTQDHRMARITDIAKGTATLVNVATGKTTHVTPGNLRPRNHWRFVELPTPNPVPSESVEAHDG